MFTPAFTANVPDVLIVDAFYASPLDVRAFALQQAYHEEPNYHKVRRSQPHRFPGAKERFEQLLGVHITDWEEQGYNGVFQYGVGGDQIVYHSDSQRYAAIVYLTPDAPPSSGTNLYRSKATGLRLVNQQTAQAKGMTEQQAVERTFGKKLLDPTAWELVDSLGNVFNRCLLWNAKLIHAAANYFGTNLHDGRLSQIFFFNAEPREPATLLAPYVPTNLPELEELLAIKPLPENTPLTPEMLMEQANHTASLLLKFPSEKQADALQHLDRTNEVLGSLVRKILSDGK